MKNWHRWTLSLAVGAFGGLISIALVPGEHSLQDFGRGTLIGMAPTVAALKMTLSKDEDDTAQ